MEARFLVCQNVNLSLDAIIYSYTRILIYTVPVDLLSDDQAGYVNDWIPLLRYF